ncbi:MAG: YdjY domain-containing protein [Gemmataceae bacterium]
MSRPPTAEKGDKKPVEIGKNVSLEVLPSGQRRVLVNAVVSFRQGPLEMFMCRRFTKEHESVVAAECDARDIHTALLAAGAVPGAPVKFEPKYEPATGTPIKVFVRYEQDKKEITLDAREWVRDVKTQKPLAIDWVFAGSFFYADPMNAKNQLYAANSGDVICVSNFGTAMLDLPIESSSTNDELQFEAFTDKIPALGTPVTVILEPQTKK